MTPGRWLKRELGNWKADFAAHNAVILLKLAFITGSIVWCLGFSGPRFDPLYDGGDGLIGRTLMSASLLLTFLPNAWSLRRIMRRFAVFTLICALGWGLGYGLVTLAGGSLEDQSNGGMGGGLLAMFLCAWSRTRDEDFASLSEEGEGTDPQPG